jgi:hypothetical protein
LNPRLLFCCVFTNANCAYCYPPLEIAPAVLVLPEALPC